MNLTKLNLMFSDLKPISGVYMITNLKTGKIYIGQSKNILLRWITHVTQLLTNSHPNKELQDDFYEFGLSSFSVKIIEECEEFELRDWENSFVKEYKYMGLDLYNKTV